MSLEYINGLEKLITLTNVKFTSHLNQKSAIWSYLLTDSTTLNPRAATSAIECLDN